MEIIFTLFLGLHILGGSIGLITGTINVIREKGNKIHKSIGKLFLYGMLNAGISALILSLLHTNYFLFIVGVFTIYMVGTGQRYIIHKFQDSREVEITDWLLTAVMLLFGLAFIVYGVYLLITGQTFGTVFLVFGFLSLRFVQTDFKNYKGSSVDKNYWQLGHLQRMTGGYIAALTAFLVVNINYLPATLPAIIVWLLPTIIFTPLIIRWSRKYKSK